MKIFTKLFLVSILIVSIILTGCEKNADSEPVSKSTTQEIVFNVESYGSPADSTRVSNLQEAAEELNKILEEKGENKKIQVNVSHVSSGYDEYNQKFILAHKSNKGADIRVISHSDVPMMAEGGYILALDDYINNSEWSEYIKDIYPNLWDSTKWQSKTYGVPQDTEARPLYFRKDILRKLGWSEDKISALPDEIKEGKFTLKDMTELAKEAVDKGVAKAGIYHRPNNGAFFVSMIYDFGGKLYDDNSGKLVFDKQAIKDALDYFYEISQVAKVVPTGMTSMEWRQIHQDWVEGNVLFWYGGTWHWAEYQEVEYHRELGKLSEDYMFENIGYALIPAAKEGDSPITLSQPYVYVINSNTKHPDLAFALVALASQPEYNAKHAVGSGHLVISPSAAQDPVYKENKFLSDVQYMLNYTTIQPNHPEFGKLTSAFFKAIQAIEIGEYDAEQALNWMENQVKNDIKNIVFTD